VRTMLDAYFSAAAPVVQGEAGEIVQTVGDAVLAVFRDEGHERRAARAGLQLQQVCAALPGRRPDWPRFRVGINSGEALVGLVQAPGARSFTPTGDVVNTGARLEQQARAGEVVVSARTRAALGQDAVVEDLGDLPVKGKERPVRAYVLRALPAPGSEGDERLQDQDPERDG
jgi:adenylate cyclase